MGKISRATVIKECLPTRQKNVPTYKRFFTRLLPAFLLLALLAVLIYSNTFSVPFVFDDPWNIIENPRIKDLKGFLDFSGTRYLGYLSFALNYHFGKFQLFDYHLVNLTIHILNAGLVYGLTRLLFNTPALNQTDSSSVDRASWLAAAVALLFVVHPIQTETVTYIVQRFASLAAFFYLIAVVCYLKWRLSESKSQLFWYGAALLAIILAMKTKEISFTLPIMLVLIEVVFFQASQRRPWAALIPFLATLLIIPLSHIDAVGEGDAGFAQETDEISRGDYLLTQFRVIVTYLRLLVLPIHQNLDYGYPIYHSLFAPTVLFSFLFLLILFGLSLYFVFGASSASLRLMGFGILWFFLTLSVESSIIPIRDVIFEHRLYLPSVGFFLSCMMLADEGVRYRKRLGLGSYTGALLSSLFILVIFLLSLSTYMRNDIWKDEVRLWEDVVKKAPQNARGYINLGAALERRGENEKAVIYLEQALKLDPNRATAHNNLGSILGKQGKLDEAMVHFSQALKIHPDFTLAHDNFGVALLNQGKIEEALPHFKAALRMKPQFALAHSHLGKGLSKQGKLDEAIAHFREALRMNPDDDKVHSSLAAALVRAGKTDEAITHYSEAIRLNPTDGKAHYQMADLLLEQGNDEMSKKHLLEAMRLYPSDEDAPGLMGNILEKEGNIKEAISFYRQAVQNNLNSDIAHNHLGVALGKDGKLDEAIIHFSQAVQINPMLESAHTNLGVSFITQGKAKEAITHLQNAIQINSKDDKAQYNLGIAYVRLGRREEAIRAFKAALQINAQLSEASRVLGMIDRAGGS